KTVMCDGYKKMKEDGQSGVIVGQVCGGMIKSAAKVNGVKTKEQTTDQYSVERAQSAFARELLNPNSTHVQPHKSKIGVCRGERLGNRLFWIFEETQHKRIGDQGLVEGTKSWSHHKHSHGDQQLSHVPTGSLQ
ncbi:hypothetical protein HDU93_009764, partial [Gonapodya sp. JEL0774]